MAGTIIYVDSKIYYAETDEIGEALEQLLANNPEYTEVSTDWEDSCTSIIEDKRGRTYTVTYSYVDEFTTVSYNKGE